MESSFSKCWKKTKVIFAPLCPCLKQNKVDEEKKAEDDEPVIRHEFAVTYKDMEDILAEFEEA